MTAGPGDGTVRVKLTISREEHPAMFEALIGIKNPRRRTGRLKELVIKALTLEQVGGTAAIGPFLANGGRPAVTSDRDAASAGLSGTSVASMLDWEASQT